MYRLGELRSSEHRSVCQRLLSLLVLTRTLSGNASAGDFISVVLMRTLPGALSRLISFAMTLLFRALHGFYCYQVLSLNWIHSKIISGAIFCIIGLTKIPKLEFLH